MNAAKPWENLRRVTKVEIVPAPGREEVFVVLEESREFDEWQSDILNYPVVSVNNRRIVLSSETVKFHYDYPDDFKKLVYHFGDKVKAYHAYNALQRSVPEKWDICDKDGEFDCDC